MGLSNITCENKKNTLSKQHKIVRTLLLTVGVSATTISLVACGNKVAPTPTQPIIPSISTSPAKSFEVSPREIRYAAVYGDIIAGHGIALPEQGETIARIPDLVGWNWRNQEDVWQTNPMEEQPGDAAPDSTEYLQTDDGLVVSYTYNSASSSQKDKFVTRILVFDPQTGQRKSACDYAAQLDELRSDGHILVGYKIGTDTYNRVRSSDEEALDKRVRVNPTNCATVWERAKIEASEPVVSGKSIMVFYNRAYNEDTYVGVNTNNGTTVWKSQKNSNFPTHSLNTPEGQIPNSADYFAVDRELTSATNSLDVEWYSTQTGIQTGVTNTIPNEQDTKDRIGSFQGTTMLDPKTGIVYSYHTPDASAPLSDKSYLTAWTPDGKQLWKNTESEPTGATQVCEGRVWYKSGDTYYALNAKTGKLLVDGEDVDSPSLCVSSTQGVLTNPVETIDFPPLTESSSTGSSTPATSSATSTYTVSPDETASSSLKPMD